MANAVVVSSKSSGEAPTFSGFHQLNGYRYCKYEILAFECDSNIVVNGMMLVVSLQSSMNIWDDDTDFFLLEVG